MILCPYTIIQYIVLLCVRVIKARFQCYCKCVSGENMHVFTSNRVFINDRNVRYGAEANGTLVECTEYTELHYR